MSERAAPYGKQETNPAPRTLMEIFGEEAEIKKRKLDQDLTWEIGRNEHAKRLLWQVIAEITELHTDEILDRLQTILSCLEKPRPKD
jgi:hypothetical protein